MDDTILPLLESFSETHKKLRHLCRRVEKKTIMVNARNAISPTCLSNVLCVMCASCTTFHLYFQSIISCHVNFQKTCSIAIVPVHVSTASSISAASGCKNHNDIKLHLHFDISTEETFENIHCQESRNSMKRNDTCVLYLKCLSVIMN